MANNKYYGLDVTLADLQKEKGYPTEDITADELLKKAQSLGGNVTMQDVTEFFQELAKMRAFNDASIKAMQEIQALDDEDE